MVIRLFSIPIFFILCACSLQARKDQADVRSLYEQGEYTKALERLEGSEIQSREENRLLYLLQKGRLLRAEGLHGLAAENFEKASELMDRLYTKSVKEALLTSVSNDNAETYYGSPYERSLLFYNQALSFLQIYQDGFILMKTEEKVKNKDGKEEVQTKLVKKKLSEQDRERYLYRARAAIVAWDVFYMDLQRSSRESTQFDHDLFAKILGAKIHELVGNRDDFQIALQLYKDAYDILEKTGPAFKSFNENFKVYARSLKGEKIEEKASPQRTDFYQGLKEFLKVKILTLTKKRQSWKYQATLKKLKPSKETLGKVGKKKNVTLLLESGVVAPLVGEEFSFNLRSALEQVEDPNARAFIAGVGLPVLTYFAMGPLGLASVSHSGNSTLYVRHSLGEAMTAEAGIEFEMPVIKEPETPIPREVLVYRQEENKEELVARKNMVLAGPVSDLAYQMNLERASNGFSERGARIAIKHVIAIIAAYKTYQAIEKTSGEVFAKPAAFAQYLISAKAIKESERADTRQWSILPSEVFLSELSLEPGEYKVKLAGQDDSDKPIELGAFSVKDSREAIFSFFLP